MKLVHARAQPDSAPCRVFFVFVFGWGQTEESLSYLLSSGVNVTGCTAPPPDVAAPSATAPQVHESSEWVQRMAGVLEDVGSSVLQTLSVLSGNAQQDTLALVSGPGGSLVRVSCGCGMVFVLRNKRLFAQSR